MISNDDNVIREIGKEDPDSLVIQGLMTELVSGVEGFVHSLDSAGHLKVVSKEASSLSLSKSLSNEGPEAMKTSLSCFEFEDESDITSDLTHTVKSTCNLNPGFLSRGKKRSQVLPKKSTTEPVSELPLIFPINTFSPVVKRARSDQDDCGDQACFVVGYVYSNEVIAESNRIPKVKGRALHVHELIKSYQLLSRLKILASKPATIDDLKGFHSGGYIDYIRSLDDTANRSTDEDGLLDTTVVGEEFGLGYDCPSIPKLLTFMQEIAGSTMTAVKAVLEGNCKIAINFHGGWHHSKPAEASGFCYVNDIVIGILYALKQPGVDRVLYLDFDLHHGDAVQDAFAHSSRVMTVSFHKYEISFFPGTGPVQDIGTGKGKGYSVNVPLREGMSDVNYEKITTKVLTEVYAAFSPDLVVCQFGADGLAKDPMQSFNLTPESLVSCLRLVKHWRKPTVVLGGGGYNFINTAKTWTQLTAAALGLRLPVNIPENYRFFLEYGPSFDMTVDKSSAKDHNDSNYLSDIFRLIRKNLMKYVVKDDKTYRKRNVQFSVVDSGNVV